MATISSPGVGSGLDVKSIVSQLVELEKRPLTQVQLRTTAAQARLSVVGQIKSQLAALDDSLRALTLGSTYQAMSVKSSAEAVRGSASSTALEGQYNVTVSQIAQGQVARSAVLNGSVPVGSGTLTIETGQWDSGPVFTPQGSALTINVTATDKLADIAKKINDANGAVRAVVVNDTGGQRLVLRATGTGVNAGFRVQVADGDGTNTDNNGLSRLGYDPAAGTFGLTQTQAAQDTVATVDGVSVTSSNRTIANVIPGVTLEVSAVTSQPAVVDVARDGQAVRKAVEGFVSAYNQLNQLLSEALKYDPQTGNAGPMQGDTTMVTLQGALRRLIGAVGPGVGDLKRWSDLGVQLGRDGNLSLNGAKLDAALADPAAVKNLLANTDGPVKGLAVQLRDFTGGALASGGRMSLKTQAIEGDIKRLQEQAKRINEKAARSEERLLAQYARLDTTLSQFNALNQYVTQQVAQWNKAGNR
jgi:flagellar hook-associated protein 2